MVDAQTQQVLQQRSYRDGCGVLEALENAGFQARFAGGCVRDRFLGLIPKDYDVATDARPEQVCTVFKQKNLKVVPTGIEHGTVTVVTPSGPVEVTTLRRDVSTDGRRAVVAFGDSFRDDAERRDFTMNAMFEDRRGKVFDYFDGQRHLQQKKLVFVGETRQRVREDYLRMLRLFRFMARFGFSTESQTLEILAEEKAGLTQISQERITQELLQMSAGQHLLGAVQAMASAGITSIVWPELLMVSEEQLLQLQNANSDQQTWLVLAASLLAATSTVTELEQRSKSLSRHWKLSRRQTQRLCILVQAKIDSLPDLIKARPGLMIAYFDRLETAAKSCFDDIDSLNDAVFPAWFLLYPDQAAILRKLQSVENQSRLIRHKRMPVDGKYLQHALNIKPGEQLGELLRELQLSFWEGQWQTREEALAYIKSFRKSSTKP